MKLEYQDLEELHSLYQEVMNDPFDLKQVPVKKRAVRRDRSLKKFNQRLKKTGWPITKRVYDETLEKEIIIPHNANLSLLKNNPQACRTCCNQKWLKKNYNQIETRVYYIKQNDHMKDIEKDHFYGSWDDVNEFEEWQLICEEYSIELAESFFDHCAYEDNYDEYDLWHGSYEDVDHYSSPYDEFYECDLWHD